jgi:hypothetical protein
LALVAIFVAGAFAAGPARGQVVFQEVRTGVSEAGSLVGTSAALTGVAGDLYVASVSFKPNVDVVGLAGLGLNWTELRSQCGGRSQTGVSVWWARGTPTGSDVVTATLAQPSQTAAIAVARYSGVREDAPFGDLVSGNTNGVGGACSGGVDDTGYSLPLSVTLEGSIVFGTAAMRRHQHFPGQGYTERTEVLSGSGGSASSVAIQDRTIAASGTLPVEGSFSSTVDWAVVGVEIRAADACTSDPDCDDGLFCNGAEACVAGACVAGSAVDCDDGVSCTLDSCNEATDACDHAADDALCDNGLFCDGVEICDPALGCRAGSPVDCSDGVGCTVDACNEATDACDHAADDALCDNGQFCDGDETCDALLDCQAGSDPCPGAFSCDEVSDTCSCSDDTQCDDGVFCNGVETCSAGVCIAGSPVDCDDGVGCTLDACNEGAGACDHAPDDAVCNDGLFCNGLEACDPLLDCQAGAPVVCDDGVGCTLDACNEGTDACDHQPDDGSCDNGLFCDGAEICDASLDCQPGADPCGGVACDEEGDFCQAPQQVTLLEVRTGTSASSSSVATTESLTASPGHLYVASISSKRRSDVVAVQGLGLDWTEVRSQCSGRNQTGVSVWMALGVAGADGVVTATFAGTPNNAVIAVARYVGASQTDPVGDVVSGNSNGASGACGGGVDSGAYSFDLAVGWPGSVAFGAAAMRSHEHFPGPGYTEQAEVLAGSGGGTASVAIQDQLVGTAGTLPVDGTFDDDVDWAVVAMEIRAPNSCTSNADCDDGLFCNGAETCAAGACVAGTPVGCDDGVGCTIDACNEATDACDHTTDDALCDNGLFCDGVETCSAVVGCQAGTPVDCNDGVGCTLDSCNETTQACDNAPNDGLCNDGLFCNGSEICDAALDCQAGSDPCPGLSCDEVADSCQCATNQDCDDGTFCNGVEICQAGICAPGTPPDCDDGVACTSDSCDGASDACLNVPNDGFCDNGLFCDGIETCDPLLDCRLGSDPCNGFACDEGTNSCQSPLEDFTIVVLPDTQNYASSGSATFEAQTQWIVDNKDSLNIEYVAHLGDCVDNADVVAEWELADDAMSLLEDPVTTQLPDGMPYGIAVGNHDQDPVGDAGTTSDPGATTALYNQYFGVSRFENRNYYGDHFGTNNDNHYDLFSAGGRDFVVLYLEFDGANSPLFQSVLPWADGVIAAFPNRLAIVVSHFVLEEDGTFGPLGQEIYDELKEHPNFFLMLGGHRLGESRRTDTFDDNTVHTLLSNYQGRRNGGDGWLRIMEFSLANQELRVSTYSVTRDEFETDADSEFTLALPSLPPTCSSNADCDDGLYCNGAEACIAGICSSGAPVDCDDGIACTVDSCNEATNACDSTPSDVLCDNGVFCDGSETCSAVLGCQAGAPVACDDGVGCTVDSCNEATDSCDYAPNDAACDNGLFCDGVETCDPALDCQPGSQPCANGCDEASDTCNCISDGECDDGLFCNGPESCVGGNCTSGAPVDCSDGVGCTVDACDEALDACQHTADDGLCDNGLFCDGTESCDATLDCQPGTPVDCSDAVGCTVDACNEATDSCDHVPDDAACDNGAFCDGFESCSSVLDCQPGAPPCTNSTCDEAADVCDEVSFAEVETGSAESATAVTTDAPLTGVAGDLYLASIATKPDGAVVGVSGLGLSWTQVAARCSGRAQQGLSLWQAQGSPTGDGVVTATLAQARTAVIAVARYSRVSSIDPIGSVVTGNTNGVDGACTGGTDGNSYSFDLTMSTPNSMAVGVAAMRQRGHSPGADYIERAEVRGGNGGNAASTAVQDQLVLSPGVVPLDGSFSAKVDWVVIGVEIRKQE